MFKEILITRLNKKNNKRFDYFMIYRIRIRIFDKLGCITNAKSEIKIDRLIVNRAFYLHVNYVKALMCFIKIYIQKKLQKN